MIKYFRFFILFLISFSACKKEKDFVLSLPSCSDDVVFTVSPVAFEDIIRFIPLGHYYPEGGHVFPTDHHYIDVIRDNRNIAVYAPCDGWITYVTENKLPSPRDVEYTVSLWACRDILVKYGHLSRLDQSIIDQLGKVIKTHSYSTGGQTYDLKIYEPRIEVRAGDRIGELPDMPGISGIDFGTYDKRKVLPLLKPERWKGYDYKHTVSFLNYATDEIRDFYFDVVQNRNEGHFQRIIPPLQGQVCYDVEGSAQGIWFLPGHAVYPEDIHLSLILNHFNPRKYVISMGRSVPGIPVYAYEFFPETNGTNNRPFSEIKNDGKIYTFKNFLNVHNGYPLPSGYVILMQLTDKETLRIELQSESDGPPWKFGNNYVDFKR